jgi:hypothetical protein
MKVAALQIRRTPRVTIYGMITALTMWITLLVASTSLF